MPYTSVFGAQPIYSSQPSLLELALVADVELDWPLETIEGGNILATIIDVTPAGPGFSITLPDATQGTPGYAVTFTNHGGDLFTVLDNTSATVLTVGSGESWTLYLRSNLTVGGIWYAFQQGAGVSVANAASLAGAGLKAISTTLNTKIAVNSQGVNYVIAEADRATAIMWTGGVGQFTLPDPAVVGSDWYVPIKNAGSGSLTVVPTSGTIDGSGSLVLGADESAFFYTDGVNFYTVGLGQEVNSVFDFISINIAGTGDYTLSGVELNRISYKFTGVLTGNRSVIVPASVQQYWVDNETTGAFTLTIKCAGGLDPGKTIAQNNRNIFYCDGANVVDAVSGAFTPPLSVGAGGTGATTLTGYVKGNGVTPLTASPTIPYADLTGTPVIPVVPPIPSGANPSVSVGLATVNGAAFTYMRSDAAPPLSQAIAPTWTGQHTWALPLRAPDDSAAAPAHTWASDLDSGVARLGPDIVGLVAGAAARMTVTTTGVSTTVAMSGPSFTTTSFRASKRETGRVTRPADILARLRPLFYRLLDKGNDQEQLGLIAEEVNEVCPQLSDGKTVAYDRLAILLLAAWQDEHAEQGA